jgi:uncharacterized protein YggT (Ycf19 family)
MLVGFLVGTIIRALIFVIIAGSLLATIKEITHPNWGRNLWVRLLIVVAETLCRPARRLMVGVGIPTRPLDFSPMVTIIAFEVVGRLLGLVL